MAIGIAIGLGICALVFVLYPLYGSKSKRGTEPGFGEPASEVQGSTEPAEREQAARNALQEVELDYQLGNIADGDYQTLRERYMRRALVALKFRYDREQELDELIEEQLRKMKEGHEKQE
jgi:hypothetical protein